ncbi:MAG: ParA family protein [Alphaproteobacteria bacterium]|nr:MAG: ParA family protein [Alphaproteobacteria bacterium]
MTGRIIAVAQQKGGSGKTTLAAHMAVAWAQMGHRVATMDIDPQGSLSRWFAVREAQMGNESGLVHCQLAGWRVQKEVENLAAQHDIVLIDSPPHTQTEARLALRAADLALIPLQPSPMDMWATQPILDLAQDEQTPALLVLNRMPPRGALAEAAVAELPKLGVPIARTRLGNRIAYAAALVSGRSVTETGGSRRASEEISALAEEVLKHIIRLERKTSSTMRRKSA